MEKTLALLLLLLLCAVSSSGGEPAESCPVNVHPALQELSAKLLTYDLEQEVKVAFSALLGDDNPEQTDISKPVVFKDVITNIGNAYNAETGIFTAPGKGVYFFEFHLVSTNAPGEFGGALMKNGEPVVSAVGNGHAGSGYTSNNAFVITQDGDQFHVSQATNSDTFDRRSTFSGSKYMSL